MSHSMSAYLENFRGGMILAETELSIRNEQVRVGKIIIMQSIKVL